MVRGHPFGESNTLLNNPATRIWELFAWTSACDPPRPSGGEGPAQHAPVNRLRCAALDLRPTLDQWVLRICLLAGAGC